MTTTAINERLRLTLFTILKCLLISSLLVSYNFNMAAGDTFLIVTSQETSCPGEFSGVPCLTLQQYVSNPSISSGNVTLLFETGNHTLGSDFSASSATKYSLSGDNVNIECISYNVLFNFRSVREVYMSGINFLRCRYNSFSNSASVTITNSIFSYNSGISLINIETTTITNTTFNSLSGRIYLHNGIRVTFTNNMVNYNRGGINFTNYETVKIDNCRVQYGIATQTPPISLSQVEECYIYGSLFLHNRNGGLYRRNSYGGVFKVQNSALNIYDSVFQNNTADYGGVIYATDVYEWSSHARYNNITIVNSTFNNNGVNYDGGRGGVVYVTDNQGFLYGSIIVLTIQNCIFNDNTANYGGVLYYSGSHEVNIMNSEFENKAVTTNYGGAIYCTTTLILTLNSFSGYRSNYGGAIYDNSQIVVTQNTFFNNTAVYEAGAIYSTSMISVTQSNFSHNTGSQRGGAISSSGLQCIDSTFINNSAVNGGAVFVSETSFFNNCDFINNTASNYGGGIHITGRSLLVMKSLFTRNTALTLGGGAIYSNSRYSNVSLSECTFSYNSASYCSVLDVDELYHFNVSITDSVFTYNTATGELLGGGVACIRNSSVDILRSKFEHNQAALHGGVFYMDECNTIVDESVFINNSASADGGVFYTYVHPSYYDIRRSEFSYNSAGDDGGVIFIGRVNSQVNISACVFSFNNASDRGGVAALIGSSMYLELNRSDIFNNTAEYGGIISACNSVVTVMEDELFLTTDPVYSFCTLYDGHVVHYHISPPVDAQTTPSPSTTSVSSNDMNDVTSHNSDMAFPSTGLQSSVEATPSETSVSTSREAMLTSLTSSGTSNINYLTSLEREATAISYSHSPLTYTNSHTYPEFSPPLGETMTALATVTEKLPVASQSLSTNSINTDYKTSLTVSYPEHANSYSEMLKSSLSEMTHKLVKPTQTAKSSLQRFEIVYQNTHVPPANHEKEKGSINSDDRIKINVTMAMSVVFFVTTLATIIVLTGMIIILIKLYKSRQVRPSTTLTYREEENPLFEPENTETEMKDNF